MISRKDLLLPNTEDLWTQADDSARHSVERLVLDTVFVRFDMQPTGLSSTVGLTIDVPDQKKK